MEGEIGRFRRRHLVPVPSVALLAEVNQQIAAADLVDDDREGVAAGIAYWEPYWLPPAAVVQPHSAKPGRVVPVQMARPAAPAIIKLPNGFA